MAKKRVNNSQGLDRSKDVWRRSKDDQRHIDMGPSIIQSCSL